MLPAKLEPADNENESDVHQMELQSLVYDYPTVREFLTVSKGEFTLNYYNDIDFDARSI